MVIQDFPCIPRSAAKIIGLEALATLGALLLLPFGMSRTKLASTRRTPRAKDQRTIVMVHGYLANKATLLPLATFLRAKGYGRCLSYEYRATDGIEQAAIGLKKFLKRHVRGGRVDLVCHSLGGLISRVYLQELGGARRVDHCITLGTPHRGTYNAYWVPSRVGQELRPDSKLLARLAATQAKASKVRFLSIIGGSDNIVIPRVFAKNADDFLHIPGLGHLGLLFSPEVFLAVLKRLGSVLPQDVPAHLKVRF